MPEYCNHMMKKEELDEQVFDDDAVIPSITIFSYEPAPPEDMGFFAPGYKKLENREQRKKEVEQAIEEITPTLPEKKVEGQEEEEKKDEDLECEFQLSPMDVDKVLVNGVELTELTFICRLLRQWLWANKCLHKDPQSQEEDGIVERQKLGG